MKLKAVVTKSVDGQNAGRKILKSVVDDREQTRLAQTKLNRTGWEQPSKDYT